MYLNDFVRTCDPDNVLKIHKKNDDGEYLLVIRATASQIISFLEMLNLESYLDFCMVEIDSFEAINTGVIEVQVSNKKKLKVGEVEDEG